jgi:hypothetical protein
MFVKTGVVTTWNSDFVIVNAIRPSTIHAEFTRDAQCRLYRDVRMFKWTIGIGAIGEELAVLSLFSSNPFDGRTRMAHVALFISDIS